ncbi:MAG: hypothetical protein KC978_08965 [Candidatus Omnitrophica bacterium]|nr:hypothetical protein [Candidatus Omnitrophota bacterium]
MAALEDANFGTASLINVGTLLSNEITIFNDRVRVDVQTSTPGISFQDAWERREILSYESQSFFVLSKPDLIATKKASGRSVDLEDVRILEL